MQVELWVSGAGLSWRNDGLASSRRRLWNGVCTRPIHAVPRGSWRCRPVPCRKPLTSPCPRTFSCFNGIHTYLVLLSGKTRLQNSPIPPVLGDHNYFVSMDLSIMDMSYKWNYIIRGLGDWLLSLSVFSRFTHTVACISTSFLCKAELHSTLWIYQNLFFHSSVAEKLNSFYFLAIMNNVAVTIHLQVCVGTIFFSSWIYTSE